MVFVESSIFESLVYEYFTEEEYAEFQKYLMAVPDAGNIIQGAGGIRKIRFKDSKRGKGKRGGLRVIYYWYSGKDQIFLVTLYAKGEVKDLSRSEKKILKQLMQEWKDEQA